MKKIKIALIITLVLSIAFTGIYIIGYPKLVKKGNINVKYTSETAGNSDTSSESPLNISSDSAAEENYEAVTGYIHLIYTIETTENLKEDCILVTIDNTLYNAYRNIEFFNENNESLDLCMYYVHKSNCNITCLSECYKSDKPDINWYFYVPSTMQNFTPYEYMLDISDFDFSEEHSLAKYFANETTYIMIFPIELVKIPKKEIVPEDF